MLPAGCLATTWPVCTALQIRQNSHQSATCSVSCKAEQSGFAEVARAGVKLGVVAVLATASLHIPEVQAAVQQHSPPDYRPVAADLGNLAENENFWQNFIQYGRFFTSVLVSPGHKLV